MTGFATKVRHLEPKLVAIGDAFRPCRLLQLRIAATELTVGKLIRRR